MGSTLPQSVPAQGSAKGAAPPQPPNQSYLATRPAKASQLLLVGSGNASVPLVLRQEGLSHPNGSSQDLAGHHLDHPHLWGSHLSSLTRLLL